MVFSEPLEDVVRRRYSVRTYVKKQIPENILEQIGWTMKTLAGPFHEEVAFRLIEAELEPNGAKLGTYGMIKGASVFVGAAVRNTLEGILALGFEFEQLILHMTTLRLGTCWLGGTFNRSEFTKAMDLPEGMIFPAISPVGFFEKKRLTETLVRGFVKADTRKPWETLFFHENFATPLTAETAEDYAFPLEMVRLGPSASNKQPWRIVRAGKAYHFYEYKLPGYSGAFDFDMQSIDMGIAACHFSLAAQEKGLMGHFDLAADPKITQPDNILYKYSWVEE